MNKRTLVTFLTLGLLTACGGPPAPATPTPEPAAQEPEAEEPEVTQPAAEEPEAEEPAGVVPTLPPEEPARPPCHTIEKSRCRVTQGCVWYEKGGKGECQDD